MKKYILTLICVCLFANSSMAEFSMPKISFVKKEVKTTADKTNKKAIKNTEQAQTDKSQTKTKKEFKPLIKKDSKQNPSKSTTIKPKESKPIINFKRNKVEEITLTTQSPEVKPETKKNKKFDIKNPFKKKTPTVGEDMVSKEQVKEELERVQNLSQKAVALYTDNNLEEALNTFLKIPEKYRTAQDNLLVGNILLDLGKTEDAIFMYKRAILTDEYFYKPYYNIGNICLNDDKYFMAIDYYKKAIKYAPEFPYAYYNIACAYIKAGDLRKAKSNLTKAIELKNTEADFHYNLAYVYKKLNKPKQAQIYLSNYNKLTNGQ